MATKIILTAYANAVNDLKRIDQEAKDMTSLFTNAKVHKHNYSHQIRRTVDPGQFVDAMENFRDELDWFHYAGHAEEQALFFVGDAVHADGVGAFLKDCPKLRVVVLNGCCTYAQALALYNSGIPIVIGTSADVEDDRAYTFAARLYGGLIKGESIFDASQAALRQAKLPRRSRSIRGVVPGGEVEMSVEEDGVWCLLGNEKLCRETYLIEQPKEPFKIDLDAWICLVNRDEQMTALDGTILNDHFCVPLVTYCLAEDVFSLFVKRLKIHEAYKVIEYRSPFAGKNGFRKIINKELEKEIYSSSLGYSMNKEREVDVLHQIIADSKEKHLLFYTTIKRRTPKQIKLHQKFWHSVSQSLTTDKILICLLVVEEDSKNRSLAHRFWGRWEQKTTVGMKKFEKLSIAVIDRWWNNPHLPAEIEKIRYLDAYKEVIEAKAPVRLKTFSHTIKKFYNNAH